MVTAGQHPALLSRMLQAKKVQPHYEVHSTESGHSYSVNVNHATHRHSSPRGLLTVPQEGGKPVLPGPHAVWMNWQVLTASFLKSTVFLSTYNWWGGQPTPKSIGKTANFTRCDRQQSNTVHARTVDTCPSLLNALSSRHERISLIIEKDILILFKGVKNCTFRVWRWWEERPTSRKKKGESKESKARVWMWCTPNLSSLRHR